MVQTSVSGWPHGAGSAPKKWGELLSSLECGEGLTRRVVTAVRFAGVAQPTFREPAALDQTLSAIGVIDVETSTVDELLLTSARAARAAIAPFNRATERIATGLRSGSEMDATLPALVRLVQTLATVTARLARAGTCAEPHCADLDAVALRLRGVVDAIARHQAGARWALVAEVLEHELAPALDAWILVAGRVWNMTEHAELE